jgi:hypothetical protein
MRLRIVIIAAEFGWGRGTERRSEAPLSGLVATANTGGPRNFLQFLTTLKGMSRVNFRMPSDPVRFWLLDFSGEFTGDLTITFKYDDSQIWVTEQRLRVSHFDGTRWRIDPTTIDEPNDEITIVTDSFSPFALGVPHSSVPALGAAGLVILGASLWCVVLWVARRQRLANV